MKIQTVQIWNNGQLADCTIIDAIIVSDNLSSEAVFYYMLKSEVPAWHSLPDVIKQSVDTNTFDDSTTTNTIVEGNVKISGEDYINWGKNEDVNLAAYEYICSKLNLTLIL